MPDIDKMMLKIQTPPEFNYTECLRFLDRSSRECLHQIEDGIVYKLLIVEGEFTLLRISWGGSSTIFTEILTGNPTDDGIQMIKQFVNDLFDLDRNLNPFYEMAATDPILDQVVKNHYGLRLIGIPDLWEALCWSIIGQQINLAFAYTMKKRLVETYGNSIEFEGRRHWHFPSPDRIASVTPEALKSLQFSRQKAEYSIGIANEICSGNISLEQLVRAESIEAQRDLLTKIRGVGAWTADYVIMKCLRQPAAFPIADVGLHNAIKNRLGLSEKPSLGEIRKMAENWKGWEAYATFYLWRSLYE